MNEFLVDNHTLFVSFNKVEGTDSEINFHASVEAAEYDSEDADEPVRDDPTTLAYAKGTLAYLPTKLNPHDSTELEIGESAYAHDALSPLYNKNGSLNKTLWKKIGGSALDCILQPRVIYIDKVEVYDFVSSYNLGACIPYAVANVIYNIMGQVVPVVAILGSYDGKRKAETIQQYFVRHGWKQTHPAHDLSHYLSPSRVIAHEGLAGVKAYRRRKT